MRKVLVIMTSYRIWHVNPVNLLLPSRYEVMVKWIFLRGGWEDKITLMVLLFSLLHSCSTIKKCTYSHLPPNQRCYS